MRLVEVVCAFAFGVIVMGATQDYRQMQVMAPVSRPLPQCPEIADYDVGVLINIHRGGCSCHYDPLTVSKFTPRALDHKIEGGCPQ